MWSARHSPVTTPMRRWDSAMWTRGFGRCTATATGWWSRPPPAPGPRSASGSRSTRRASVRHRPCGRRPTGTTRQIRRRRRSRFSLLAMTQPGPPAAPLLHALVVDDEAPALEELVFLLSRDHRIGPIQAASNGPDALRILQGGEVDVVF